MKIVFIGGRDIHKLGGIENYMLNLTKSLKQYNVKSVVYCESNGFRREYLDGVEIIYLPSFPSVFITKPLLGLVSTIHALLFHRDAILFHYNAWPPSLSSWLPRLFRYTTLMQGHGLEWKRTKYALHARKVVKFMEKITAHINQHLIMVSQEQTDYFAKEYGIIAKTIPCGGPFSPNPPPIAIRDETLKKFGICTGDYFLYLGRLVKEKNADVLIEAFRKMSHSSHGYKLVIAGDNSANPEYVMQLQHLAQGRDDIIFTGPVYEYAKDVLLHNCHCFCLPSSLEGLPITLLEAMAWGALCIVSDIPACHEAISDNALFVEPEDSDSLSRAMCLSIEKEDFSEFRNLNYLRLQNEFTWDIVAKKYFNCVEQITSLCTKNKKDFYEN